MSDVKINRENKDRLFKFIFGNEKCKEWTLALYNAINHSNYKAAYSIEINTIDNALYMGMNNDVSFIVENTMNLYEHQSSYNPNMPLRFLVYSGMLYSKYIMDKKNHYHRHNRVLQNIPTPKCVCFYNGTDTMEDKVELKLSDAVGNNTDIEVSVTMLNINYGHNKELLASCSPLMEYSWFVHSIREKIKLLGIADAVDKTLQEMPDSFEIKTFLVANKSEVTMMCITEYDMEEHLREEKEDIYVSLVKDGDLTIERAAERLKMSVQDFKKIMDSQK